jgi:hypothetical protein
MTENRKDAPIDLGIYARAPGERRLGNVELVAIALSLLWLLGSGLFFLILGTGEATDFDPMRFVMVVLAVFMPVAMIWVAATAAASAKVMREEAARLQASIEAMRKISVTQAQTSGTMIQPSVEKKIDELVRAQRKTETAIATFTSIRQAQADRVMDSPAQAPAPAGETQPSLALGSTGELHAQPLSVADYITALNFPETAEDREGFRALRRALQDRRAARLIQASQDVLTLLSQDGIYMDDMSPDRARPELWRRFAGGERGRTIAALGGIRDRSSLALAVTRMRQDTIFRDAVHHFLRTFDSSFQEFEKTATDAEIAALTDTRTARAFMLLGRATGIFD